MSKTCSFCQTEKELYLFSNDRTKADGKYPKCKECKAVSDKKYRIANLHKIKENSVKYYQEKYG